MPTSRAMRLTAAEPTIEKTAEAALLSELLFLFPVELFVEALLSSEVRFLQV